MQRPVAPERARRPRRRATEISNALTGNLCRCTGYRPIIDAAERMFDQAPLAPLNVPALAALKDANPNVRILAGSTDVGLLVSKQLRDLGDIVYIGQIESFKHVETTDEWIEIGAGVSVDRAYAELVKGLS